MTIVKPKPKEEKSPIEVWKELGIDHCVASFSCGGDSMNEMEFTYHNESGGEIPEAKSELDYYFEDEIYKNVEFYVNSDGNYLGESGSVNIVLEEDDEEPYFSYDKSATSEWYETHSTKFSFPVSEKTFRLFLDKISSLSGSHSSEYEINYKVDCIITEEDETLIKELVGEVCSQGNDWEAETNGEYNDGSFNYELEDWNLLSEKTENTLYFNVSKGYYEYQGSDD